MRRTIMGVAAIAILVAGCSSTAGAPAPDQLATATDITSAPATTTSQAASRETSSSVTSPSAATTAPTATAVETAEEIEENPEAELRAALAKIDGDLDNATTLRIAEALCEAFETGESLSYIEGFAFAGFSQGASDLTMGEAQVAIAVVKRNLCPDAPAAVDPPPSVPMPTSEEEPPPPSVEHAEYTGSGDDVVDINVDSAALLHFSCPACDGNVSVTTDGDERLLVNEIGAYFGTHLINVYDGSTTSLAEITADADWTLVIGDLSELPAPGTDLSGTGDSVVILADGNTRAKITHDGESNFAVKSFGGDRPDLLVNEIGPYSGTVVIEPGVIQVNADGAWTITGS